jgi:arylsulfatase A-like enzyme
MRAAYSRPILVLGFLAASTFPRPTAQTVGPVPTDVGSILVILADDLGVDALPFTRVDPLALRRVAPNLRALAHSGVRFENAWAAPKCSPARAALQTGRAANRTGVGNVIEAGAYSLPASEVTLPEMLEWAPLPYATGYFGKWHLERRGGLVCAPTITHGYRHFDGTLLEVPEDPGYCDWRERTCRGPSETSTDRLEYMPSMIIDQAADWIRSRRTRWFCVVAPQSPYNIPHTPPPELQTVSDDPACTTCPSGTRACYDAAIQAFDTKVGELLRALGPRWHERVTVFFLADNGTPELFNRYWPPDHSKLTLFEGGVRVPFVVAGRGVAPGSRGTVSSALVSITDVYRTIAGLAGVGALPLGVAQDSFDLAPLLEDPPRPNGRTHLVAELFGQNQATAPYLAHRIAVRDARWKLIYHWSDQRPTYFFDLVNDPRETANLLSPAPPAGGTEAGQALDELVQKVHEILGP